MVSITSLRWLALASDVRGKGYHMLNVTKVNLQNRGVAMFRTIEESDRKDAEERWLDLAEKGI